MPASSNQRVNDFLNDIRLIAPEQVEKINSIRRLFNREAPELLEDIKYGGLVFLKSGVLIGGVFHYKNHISVEFSDGADFSDPSGLLEGKGKRRRHLKISEARPVDEDNLSFFIVQAVKG